MDPWTHDTCNAMQLKWKIINNFIFLFHVSVVVYGYFTMCLIGHQFFGKTDVYIPVLTILQFFFYVGWLKVAQDLMRPFGEDDDDVELNCILDRHAAVAFNLTDDVCNNNPPLIEDALFRNAMKTNPDGQLNHAPCVRLPYTKLSLKYNRDRPPKLHARVDVSADQSEMVFRKVRSNLERSVTVAQLDVVQLENSDSAPPSASGLAPTATGFLKRSKTTVGQWFKERNDPTLMKEKESVHF